MTPHSRRRHPTSSATELDGPRRSLVRSRAQSNREGPNGAAPSARLLNDLRGPRDNDVNGRPDPHFQPGTGRPPGRSGTAQRTTTRTPVIASFAPTLRPRL